MEPVFVSVKVSELLPFVPIHWLLRITLWNWTSTFPGFILVVVQISQQQRQCQHQKMGAKSLARGHVFTKRERSKMSNSISWNGWTKPQLGYAMVAFFLTMSWLPTETFFILYKFEFLRLPCEFYLYTSILAMSNSCLNLWVWAAQRAKERYLAW